MRIIRVIGANDGSMANVKLLAGGSSAGRCNDYMRLMNVLRKRVECECNWATADDYYLQTADGYCFNVKE